MYDLYPAGLVPPRPRAQALHRELDPLAGGMQADGSLATSPVIGGRWLLWPLRVVLRTAPLVIAFRGIIAIIFNSAPTPGGTGAGAASRQFPVTLAEAYAMEFGRVYLGFSPQSLGQREQALAGLERRRPAQLQSLQVAGIKVQDPQHAVVTLPALLGSDRWPEAS